LGIPLLIMAGGRATRFDFVKVKTQVYEKALLKLGSKCFIEHIIDAARSAQQIDQIYVAVSPFTPETRNFLMKASTQIEICDTPGKGYHEDLVHAVKQLKLGVILTIGTDIPLIRNIHLDQIIRHYWSSKKPALAVMSPFSQFQKSGLSATTVIQSPDYKEGLVPLGINVIDGNLIDQPELEQVNYILEEKTLLFNINTIRDYEVLLSKYGGKRRA
jgi:adenosylcobinamide-phosphate guanylyltransferase